MKAKEIEIILFELPYMQPRATKRSENLVGEKDHLMEKVLLLHFSQNIGPLQLPCSNGPTLTVN